MRKFLATALTALVSLSTAYAQLKEVDKAYIAPINILKNPGFENGTAEWTASGGALSTVTSGANLGFGFASGSWDSNGSSQTLTSKAVTIPNGLLSSTNCIVSFFYKTAETTLTWRLIDGNGSDVLSALTLPAASTFTRVKGNFNCPSSGSLSIRFTSTVADSAIIYLDNAFLGSLNIGTNTGDVTLTAVGGSPNANAASLSVQALTLQPADGSNPGVVTAGTQTIAGDKTFTGASSFNSSATFNAGVNQLSIKPGSHQFTLTAADPAANRVLTIPDTGADASFLFTQGAQTLVGVQTFSAAPILSAGLTGVTTNSSASSGIVGQVLSQATARASAVNLSTATAANVLASPLALTAGDWDVGGCIGFLPAATTSFTLLQSGDSVTSATMGDSTSFAQSNANGEFTVSVGVSATVNGGNDTMVCIPTHRILLSGTTNYYLIAKATFTVSTMTAYGSLFARRAR